MAVIVKYVVERNGKEVMTFATKKQADAYDKQLDIAERLQTFISSGGFELAETDLEELTLYMARHSDDMVKLLKGQSLTSKKVTSSPDQASDDPDESPPKRMAKSRKQPAPV